MPGRVRIDSVQLARLLNSPGGPVAREVTRVTLRGVAVAKRLLSRPGTGRLYRRYDPPRRHRASAPGQPPATDLGHGRSSIGPEFGTDSDGFYGRYGTDVEYLRHLEFGTHQGGRQHIQPRPWLRPSLDILADEADT